MSNKAVKQMPKGGKFLSEASREAIRQERRQARAEQRKQEKRKRRLAWFGLIVCNSLMMAMILNCLIDDRIGMVMLIIMSAFFGSMM